MDNVKFASGTMLPSSCSMMDDECGMAVWMVREAGCRWLSEKKQRFCFHDAAELGEGSLCDVV